MSIKFSLRALTGRRAMLSVLLALFAVPVLAAGTAWAADTIGVIDSQKILFQHPNYDAWFWWLADRNRELESADQVMVDRETDPEKKLDIIRKRNERMQQEEARVMAPIHQECYNAVAAVAKEKKMTVVLVQKVIYSGGTDITDEVVAYLKKNVKINLPPKDQDRRFGGDLKR